MSIVLPDGYVVDIIGPFYENENDASIMFSVEEIKTWLNGNDVLIVDRGFCDVLNLLRSAGMMQKCHHIFLKESLSTQLPVTDFAQKHVGS